MLIGITNTRSYAGIYCTYFLVDRYNILRLFVKFFKFVKSSALITDKIDN